MEKIPRILIVDDEERNRRLMEAMLLPFGFEVYLAGDGEESLQMVRNISPDLILMDVMMPKMDGFEVTKMLKGDAETQNIPIIIVTALRDVDEKAKALDLGADDFLSKPVEKIELRARVQSLLKVKAFNDHMRDYQRRLEAEVEDKTRQLQEAFDKIRTSSLETIYRLSRAAEFKDEETGDHIRRVSHYGAALARRAGLNKAFIEEIRYSAPMHDIGKIGIPEQILLKPGKLNSEEWEIMKQHTVIGAHILDGSGADYIKTGQVIALTHHEKWDGSGYPQGLKAEKIPMAGRITAVVDVFDALTSRRPYRGAMSIEQAFSILKNGKGKHFDPDLIDCFFAIEQEILTIKTKYRDNTEGILLLKTGALTLESLKNLSQELR